MKRFLCWPLITTLALVTGCSGSDNDGYQAGIKCALDGPGDIDSPWPEIRDAKMKCYESIQAIRKDRVMSYYFSLDYSRFGPVDKDLYILDQMEATGWRGSFDSPVKNRSMKDHLKQVVSQLSVEETKELIDAIQGLSEDTKNVFMADYEAGIKERIRGLNELVETHQDF